MKNSKKMLKTWGFFGFDEPADGDADGIGEVEDIVLK